MVLEDEYEEKKEETVARGAAATPPNARENGAKTGPASVHDRPTAVVKIAQSGQTGRQQ